MPFYLVIQTSLVEARDERSAAQKSVDHLRAGGPVNVEVKSDQTTIAHHVVAAVPVSGNPPHARLPAERSNPDQAATAPLASVRMNRKALMKRIATDAIALVTGRA